MFSFLRTAMDYIQSASGLKVKPRSAEVVEEEESEEFMKRVASSRKMHSPVARIPNTPLGNALQSYKQSLITARSFSVDKMSTALLEEDFVYALSTYCTQFTLQNGMEVLIRPILPCDIVRMREILSNGEISQMSLSLRFNTVTTGVKEHMLKYFTNVDYDSHFAVSALVKDKGVWKGVATARIIEDADMEGLAEWAAIVLDDYHGMGIGSSLLYYISQMASHFCLRQLCAIVHSDNYPVLHWMKKLNSTQELMHDCRYWVFNVPIADSWILNDEVRLRIVNAASGKGFIEEECMNEVRKSVQSLNSAQYLYDGEEDPRKVGLKRDCKERRAPVVSFVSSFEDDIDLFLCVC
ncbi:hypothetical protein WA577_007110 [Blastocystis sp. JDR]